MDSTSRLRRPLSWPRRGAAGQQETSDTDDDSQIGGPQVSTISVGSLGEHDLAAADHIMRLAFGTFLELPEPTAFMGDAGCVRTR